MRRILVGVDGSEGSENALKKALMLIDEDGELILLAVVPRDSDKTFLDKTMHKKMKEKAKQLILEKKDDIVNHNFKITELVEEGDPSAKIIDISLMS